jgi:hypothetical protein
MVESLRAATSSVRVLVLMLRVFSKNYLWTVALCKFSGRSSKIRCKEATFPKGLFPMMHQMLADVGLQPQRKDCDNESEKKNHSFSLCVMAGQRRSVKC